MRQLLLVLALISAAGPAAALYKVVGPDGKVTYTDRPPTTDASSRVAPFRPGSGPGADAAALPLELRAVVSRYPVTIYTADECAPCDAGRQLLVQRGVPFTEKRVTSADDIKAYESAMGARVLPGLSIGPQQLRGLNESDWSGYLDAAGYPKESKLPRGWKPAPATPMVAAKPAVAPAEGGAPPARGTTRPGPASPASAPTGPAAGTNIRF